MARKLRPSERYTAKEAIRILGITEQDLDTLIKPEHRVLCNNGRHVGGYGTTVMVYRRSNIDELKTDPRVNEMATVKLAADNAAREAKRLADIEQQRKFDLTMTEGDFDMYVAPLLYGDVRRFRSACEAKGITTGEVLRDAILRFLVDNG